MGGCVQAPPPAEEILEVDVPAGWGTGSAAAYVPQGWVTVFGDPQLEALVNEAISENFSPFGP